MDVIKHIGGRTMLIAALAIAIKLNSTRFPKVNWCQG
ncbi:hypothetical protein NIES932_08070 [Raphidiopsis curvata NIES-932]|nr:hypothetical protein NIES932_08070 [Raphidiopsis curvata NIES-932]